MKIVKERNKIEMFLSANKTIILILIAFLFSFGMRLIWVYEFQDVEQFKFNNELMINTNDGYYYAEGTRDIISGNHQQNDLSPVESAISLLSAFIIQNTPFSAETVFLYMPAVFSSLLVIPLILIGQSINRIEVGFIAALIGSIAHSYYNRTMIGYYDTDLLNIVFPVVLMWSLIWAIRTQKNIYILFMAFDIIAYRLWYPQSYSLEFSFFLLICGYAIYQYVKKIDFVFSIILLTFMMFGMVGLDIVYRVSIIVCLFLFLHYQNELFKKYIMYIFAASIVAFFSFGGFELIWKQLSAYIFKDAKSISSGELNLHFYTVVQTIKEAGQISFTTFGDRISGHTITFLLSFIGYVWLCIRFPIMLLGIPLLGLGFLALFGGLRFTVYAVPVMALGIGFLISEISNKISNKRSIQIIGGSILTLLFLIPNIIHIIEYKVPPVFTKDEVEVLDKLKSIAKREDYMVSWWDYGYPIRYYSDVKTIIDGGLHSGEVNFPTSFALTNPQDVAAKMLRLDVEYAEKKFDLENLIKIADKNGIIRDKVQDETNLKRSSIANMTLDNGFKNTNDFLAMLDGDVKMLPKTRDIYLYLPNSMISIYPTIKLFSAIDLMSGNMVENQFFYLTSTFNENDEFIDFGGDVKLFKKDGTLQIGNNSIKVKRFVQTKYQLNKKLKVEVQDLAFDGTLNVIYMADYKQVVIIDENTYNSTYFKLFVLEDYDKNLFEPIILTPLAKVYKLKI